jgi:SAM-dependent methyltransferase
MRSLIKQNLKYLLRKRTLRNYLHRLFLLSLEEEPPTENICNRFLLSLEMKPRIGENKDDDKTWRKLEPIYIKTRRKLLHSCKWRYGQLFVQDNTKLVLDNFAKYDISIKDKVYCDLGCGTHHPYGTSTIMYINGAASAIATDLRKADSRRSAEALYDLLLSCLAHPDYYHWSEISTEEYFSRIYSFNLKELCNGNLEAGLASVPIKYIVANIERSPIPPESIDIILSRAVLEHFFDFELACKKLYWLMKPGGIAIHLVDFADHRAYGSKEYHWWSFLAEDEQWSDELCNRLRPSEIRDVLSKTGFEILDYYEINQGEMPLGFREQIKGRFALMSDEELSTLQAFYIIKKPE